jgi:hypothetical protein
MHRHFWNNFSKGVPPAKALFDAKVTYIGEVPHGLKTASEVAIEHKIVDQFTCLGLGW